MHMQPQNIRMGSSSIGPAGSREGQLWLRERLAGGLVGHQGSSSAGRGRGGHLRAGTWGSQPRGVQKACNQVPEHQ